MNRGGKETTFSAGKVKTYSLKDSSRAAVMNGFDDENEIVILNDVLKSPVEFLPFLEAGGKMQIKVQSYTRSLFNGIVTVKEDELLPFSMSCEDYWRYYNKCNEHFEGLSMKLPAQKIYFNLSNIEGRQSLIDISSTILYAIDIPMKALSIDFDNWFKKSFMLNDLFLPGQQFCYYQFVSEGIAYMYPLYRKFYLTLMLLIGPWHQC